MSGKIIFRNPQSHKCRPHVTPAWSPNTGDVWKCDDCDRTWRYKEHSYPGRSGWVRETKRQSLKRQAITANSYGQIGIPMSKPVKAHHLIAQAVGLKGLGVEVGKVKGFNAKLAVILTQAVGTMWMAYLFCLIALTSLPAILVTANVLHVSQVPNFLTKPGLILVVAWIAQTFIQLVLLSVIMVGQSVQSKASDARGQQTWDDSEYIKDQVNEKTEGGVKVILDRLDVIEGKLP